MLIPELAWHQLSTQKYYPPAARIRSWLYLTSSMTQALQDKYKIEPHIKVIQEGWRLPTLAEAKKLKINSKQTVWCREICIYCGELPVMYAWSIFPKTVFKGKYKILQKLGSKPLGKVIFNCRDIQRSTIEITKLRPQQPVFAQAAQSLKISKITSLWARRSILSFANRNILLHEVFSPVLFMQEKLV